MRLACIAAILLAAQSAAAAVEVRSEHFRLVGEADALTIARAAEHLEATADRLRALGFHLRRPDLPVTVLIFATQEQLARFQARPQARAFAATAEDSHFIAIAWNAPGSPWLALAHEYAHLASDDGTLPPWFREGLADYLSLEREAGVVPVMPTSTINALRTRPWMGVRELLDAEDGSAARSHEMFYAQSWLAVSWLASQPDANIRRLEPRPIYDQLTLGGSAALEIQLRAHMARLALAEPTPEMPPQPASDLTPRELTDAEWQAWQLELLRGMKGNPAAEEELMTLAPNGLQLPLVQAALGALAIERGRFDEAEDRLRAAANDADASALTHHRYALMLLRPTADAPGPRAEIAVRHAQRALEITPSHPEFLRTLAQASVVAEQWDPAAEVLFDLRAKQGWDLVAAEDFQELLRRRGQTMRAVAAPRIGPVSPSEKTSSFIEPAPPPAMPDVVKTPLAPLRDPHDWPWPPPDTLIYAGRIAGVDCSSGQKRIIMHSPLFRIEFIESPKQPAKLHHPPLKWKTLPCGTYGWNVHIAYIPARGKRTITGEVRAIRF